MIFCIDFDGTVVEHEYPEVGADVPYAENVLRRLQDAGHELILWTMRSGAELADAVAWFEDKQIRLFGVNNNPTQSSWTESPKAYAQTYIDDAALGCPLRENPRMGGRPFVDWKRVEQVLTNANAL